MGGNSRDSGRVPVGAIVTVLVLIAAGYGAYWFLGSQGFLGGTNSAAEATPTPTFSGPAESDDRPVWLQATPYEMPPLVQSDDERMPEAYETPEWLWEIVDDGWDLRVVAEGDGGEGWERLADFQNLYLVSPSNDLFLAYEMDTIYLLDIVNWDAAERLAWFSREGRPGDPPVVQFDLREAVTETVWDDNAVTSANRIPDGIVMVDVVAEQPDGRELWLSYDEDDRVTGVFWRSGRDFDGSLVSDEIRRLVLGGYSPALGLDAWIDVDGMRAVYHGVYRNTWTDRAEEETWVLHDLSDDTYSAITIDAPSLECAPVDGPAEGTWDGDRIVASCDGLEWALDPYQNQEPVQR